MFNHSRGRLTREIVLVLGWTSIALLAITLFTYTPSDPGWSSTSSQDDGANIEIQNLFGIVGAYIADILLSFLGRSSYLLCVIAFIALHALLRPSRIESNSEQLSGHWCAIGVVLFILSSASLEHLRFAQNAELLPSGAGGGLGGHLAGGMKGLFGELGASIILLIIWMISWSLAAALSWFAFFEIIGKWIEQSFMFLFTRLRRFSHIKKGEKRRANENEDESDEPPEVPVETLKLDAPSQPSATPPAKTATIKSIAARFAHKKQEKKLPMFAAATEAADAIAKNKSDGNQDNIVNAPEVKSPAVSPATPATKSTATPAAKSAKTDKSLPPSSLLDAYQQSDNTISEEFLAQNSALIESTLSSFGISVKVLSAHPGPVITRYDIQPATGVKGAQIVSLVRDIARSLSVSGIRVLETIPGKNCMGLEIPNQDRATVYLSEIIADTSYQNGDYVLPLVLGKDAAGNPTTTDLTKMPHLLVAGATGSGKSVCINAMLLSLLYSSPPDKLGLILIDPKMLELASYHDIPHLLAPVVTDVSLAPAALNWAVEEMENRYRIMSTTGVRNIDSYNQKIAADNTEVEPLPYIVIVIDELADLMMTTGKKVEMTISRLAQKARAAGIHLILATQRPSVDVITGLIKANVPCRIAFQVASKVDSRTIIDQMGADMLLGMGDMLYLPAGSAAPLRVHGAYVSDDEVRRVATHLRRGKRDDYLVDFTHMKAAAGGDSGGNRGEQDELYDQAVEAVISANRPSISLVQRKLRIGYNRASRLIEDMEHAGIISPIDSGGGRKVLIPPRTNDS
ncbi:MAG: DNA translocase FtsK [Gammaproteobacteria bacterium WSBS_2016_MAG_OTU1]